MSTKDRRARFNPDPVAEVRSIPSPASSTSSLAASPGPSTPPPLPNEAFSSPAHSPRVTVPSPYHSPPQPRVYTPSPNPPAYALPYIPPMPLISDNYIHPAIASPNLLYDVRHQPSQTNPHLAQAILSHPASNPPLPGLEIRIGDLPWQFMVYPGPSVTPGNAQVAVQDVLLAIYLHLRTPVKAREYDRMSTLRKAEISQQFEHRVGFDPVQRGKGLRRIDFLNGRFLVQGLVRAQSKDNVWVVVMK